MTEMTDAELEERLSEDTEKLYEFVKGNSPCNMMSILSNIIPQPAIVRECVRRLEDAGKIKRSGENGFTLEEADEDAES